MLEVFDFPQHEEEAIYGLGFKVTLTRNEDDAVLNKAETIANARSKLIKFIEMYLNSHLPLHNEAW